MKQLIQMNDWLDFEVSQVSHLFDLSACPWNKSNVTARVKQLIQGNNLLYFDMSQMYHTE
jgi:hypothetical protein